MIYKLTGYVLIAIGGTGALYFRHYNGELIPYPTLWLIVCVIAGIAGLWLVAKSALSTTNNQERYNKERLAKLKKGGEKILLTMNNCTVKGNSYYEQDVEQGATMSKAMDAIYEPNRNYSETHITQSVIIYQYAAGNENIKMISPSYAYDKEVMERMIDSGKVSLYVNRFNKKDYMFEITVK